MVFTASNKFFLTVPVDGSDDAGSGEIIAISLGTGEWSDAWPYSEDRGDRERGDGLAFNGRMCAGASVGVGGGRGLGRELEGVCLFGPGKGGWGDRTTRGK